MEKLSQSLVDVVRTAFKGKKLEKFDASIKIINDSLAQGAWISRGSIKGNSGFYQGIARIDYKTTWSANQEIVNQSHEAWQLSHCLNFGGEFLGDFNRAVKRLKNEVEIKLTVESIEAWVLLCKQKSQAFKLLYKARPLPKITKIGLSPKVTKTLKEMNLDLDINTIKMAKITKVEFDAIDENGKPFKDWYYRIDWTEGIVHTQSRFADFGHCHACGKRIPSYMFVPVEVFDLKSQKLISLMLGCDCASNIFGVKDIGVLVK